MQPGGIQDNHWHIRKEVTLGTLLALAVYGITFMVFVVQIDARVERLEMSQAGRERVAVLEARVAAGERNLERLEERTLLSLEEIKGALRRIEERLDSGAAR